MNRVDRCVENPAWLTPYRGSNCYPFATLLLGAKSLITLKRRVAFATCLLPVC
jgi:hypothetical protein